ncbi:hypothetical protein [Salmonella phage NINP13076]|uniref:Uncharacterized protein n=1 Tax=Salmonella phage vB_SEnST11_KE22 TaxID=3161173 RepID=A0AAU8GDX8_9CAUD|nr:hypothetical protein [Salmonella phage NINP13076]
MSRFREKLNQSYCLVKVDRKGWVLAKKTGKRIYVTGPDGEIRYICTTDDTDQFRHLTESLEYESRKSLSVGDTVKLDNFGLFYVVDAGYRGDDGDVKYLIAR